MSTRCMLPGARLLTCIVSLAAALAAHSAEPLMEGPAAHAGAEDEPGFFRRLARAAHHQAFVGLTIPAEVMDALVEARADAAIAALGGRAAEGDHDANIALVRLQHWCNRLVSQGDLDPQAQIDRLDAQLPPARVARAAAVLRAQADYRRRAATACRGAQFDFRGIEARLRNAAEEGHPASALELSRFTRDPDRRSAYIQAAVAQHYGPAVHALAVERLSAIQRGESTEDVASIRLLLKQAGRSVSRAKLDLANCMSLGCDGHPADAAGARAFGIDAARDGEAGAFLSMARMPWGRGLSRVQMLAWQYFGDRLNEAGCGGDAYVTNAMTLSRTIEALEARQDPETLADARERAETLWRDNGARAMREQGCTP